MLTPTSPYIHKYMQTHTHIKTYSTETRVGTGNLSDPGRSWKQRYLAIYILPVLLFLTYHFHATNAVIFHLRYPFVVTPLLLTNCAVAPTPSSLCQHLVCVCVAVHSLCCHLPRWGCYCRSHNLYGQFVWAFCFVIYFLYFSMTAFAMARNVWFAQLKLLMKWRVALWIDSDSIVRLNV